MKRISTLLLAVPMFFIVLTGCQKEVKAPAQPEGFTASESIGKMLQGSALELAVNGIPMAANNGPSNPLAGARSQAKFSILTVALAKTGLLNTLMKLDADYTLFAPTDEAFIAAGLSAAKVTQLPEDALSAILLYHVVGMKVPAAAVPAAAGVATLNGKQIYVRSNAKGVFVNLAQVTAADIMAKNGVVHVINKVLMPPTKTIVETAIADQRFTTLVSAVLKASSGTTNVAGILSGPGAFTVFAPTNEGFSVEGITPAVIDGLPADDITPILGYHVITTPVFSIDLTDNLMPTMFLSGKTTIRLNGGATIQGKSNTTASGITETDIICTNGIIHVINRMLKP
ncbi:MAG TPA: fasciclin domain-containing protein [Chitinophagaceae bacterium]|nr:fasciclin domain-containing protein [Chitinophagaceae bacterium]